MATFSNPSILLLDEHTAALDPSRAELIIRLTKDAVERYGLTTLMITHNMEQAIAMGNRLVMMHEGRIIYELAGEEKKKATVAQLLEKFAGIKGTLSDRTLLA